MTLTEILPSLRKLSSKDKLKAVQFLVNEIAVEEDAVFENDGRYPVWSPFDSGEAAAKLMELLEQEKKIRFFSCQLGFCLDKTRKCSSNSWSNEFFC